MKGEIVKHKIFGKGIIKNVLAGYIEVYFEESEDEKSFRYPDAIGKHIELENKLLQNELINSIKSIEINSNIDMETTIQTPQKVDVKYSISSTMTFENKFHNNYEEILNQFDNEKNFFHLDSLNFNNDSLRKSGIYFLRIKDLDSDDIPEEILKELRYRNNNYFYIGQATLGNDGRGLERRLGNELLGKGHGTFFRSIGAVLGYLPEKGSLIDKSNKKNYKFSNKDAKTITKWLFQNIIISIVIVDENELDDYEYRLITKYKPLLNIKDNPNQYEYLKQKRQECVHHASG